MPPAAYYPALPPTPPASPVLLTDIMVYYANYPYILVRLLPPSFLHAVAQPVPPGTQPGFVAEPSLGFQPCFSSPAHSLVYDFPPPTNIGVAQQSPTQHPFGPVPTFPGYVSLDQDIVRGMPPMGNANLFYGSRKCLPYHCLWLYLS
jgi:hypothetical protein